MGKLRGSEALTGGKGRGLWRGLGVAEGWGAWRRCLKAFRAGFLTLAGDFRFVSLFCLLLFPQAVSFVCVLAFPMIWPFADGHYGRRQESGSEEGWVGCKGKHPGYLEPKTSGNLKAKLVPLSLPSKGF